MCAYVIDASRIFGSKTIPIPKPVLLFRLTAYFNKSLHRQCISLSVYLKMFTSLQLLHNLTANITFMDSDFMVPCGQAGLSTFIGYICWFMWPRQVELGRAFPLMPTNDAFYGFGIWGIQRGLVCQRGHLSAIWNGWADLSGIDGENMEMKISLVIFDGENVLLWHYICSFDYTVCPLGFFRFRVIIPQNSPTSPIILLTIGLCVN